MAEVNESCGETLAGCISGCVTFSAFTFAHSETPHERFCGIPRRSSVGSSVPSLLLEPVLIKRLVRSSKTNSLVDHVELLQATLHYAHICYPGGQEATVATKHLAPQDQGRAYHQSGQLQSDFNSVSVPVASEKHPGDKADNSPLSERGMKDLAN